MSHPLLVEAIETSFVPLAIHNNKAGRDAEILERYREPSWNNPVVRFFDPAGDELLERKDGVWSSEAVAARMVAALEQDEREVPDYLTLALAELDRSEAERAVFAMHCFWQGEAALGGQAGVLSTRAAWLGGLEVVEVEFDPGRVAYADLVRTAKGFDCAERVFATTEAQLATARELVGAKATLDTSAPRDAKDSDQKYFLRKRPLRFLPLTPMQAARVNADLRDGRDPSRFLSPRQRELVGAIERKLAEQPGSLEGLVRPPSLEGLGAYQVELAARLAG